MNNDIIKFKRVLMGIDWVVSAVCAVLILLGVLAALPAFDTRMWVTAFPGLYMVMTAIGIVIVKTLFIGFAKVLMQIEENTRPQKNRP